MLRQRRAAFVAALPADAHHFAFRAPPSPLMRAAEGRETIALYLPVGDEAPAARFATRLRAAGKSLCLPRLVDREGGMRFHRWEEDDRLDPGPFGIRQPDSGAPLAVPDLILAPLVGFDRALGRLGQGGGYYDRVFAEHPHALRIGIGWSVQEVDRVPTEPWDMKLHAILTECEYIEGVPAS